MKRGRKRKDNLRGFDELLGPEKELMRKLARGHWTPEELSRYFMADLNAVNKVIKNTIKWKRKRKPKGLNNIKEIVFDSEG